MVKIYIFELTRPIRSKERSFLLSELNSSEIETLPKQKGKKFELSLIGKILVKKVISNELMKRSSQKGIHVGKTKFGKPVIKRPSNLNLDISISHSDKFLVVGICDSGKIGIDIESLKDIDFRIFRNCLSVSEERYINSGNGVMQKLENFYEIWTRKEACLKASGKGLQKPLPIIQFYPDDIKSKAEIRYDSQKYYLSTLKEKKFILSVCTTKPTAYDQSYAKLTLDKLWSFIANNKMTHSNVQNQQGN